MKTTFLVLATAALVCVATLAKSAAVYGVPASRSKSKEDLIAGEDDGADGQWWLAAIVLKRSSSPAAAKKDYYHLRRQVTIRFYFSFTHPFIYHFIFSNTPIETIFYRELMCVYLYDIHDK